MNPKYLSIGAKVYYVAGNVQEHRTGNVGVMGMPGWLQVG